MRSFILRAAAAALIFLLTVQFSSVSAYAASSDANSWHSGYKWNASANFSVDSDVKYSSQYSIKIENTELNDSYIERTFSVKPNTLYKFSAMVRYSGFSVESSTSNTGASIGISASYSHSDFTVGSSWKKLEYSFNSEDNTSVTLCLRNGMYGGTCKGTAWFSDIKLEENITEPTNKWNILVVVFKNVNAPVTKDGKSYTYSQSLDDEDIKYLSGSINKLYNTFNDISGGLMSVKKIDIVSSDKPITQLFETSDYNYYLDPSDEQVSSVLDYYLEKGSYNQIIAISPIRDIAKGWAGLGGGTYKNSYFCQINYKSRDPYPGNISYFPDAVYVHEMLHCMEYYSRTINPSKTADLHNNSYYGFTDQGDEWRAWYTAYMRSELRGGMGLDPRVYQVYNDMQFVLVSDDMSVGVGISSDKAKPDESVVSTVSYKTSLNVKATVSSNSVTLSWDPINGAGQYVIYQYKNSKYTAVKKTSNTSAVINGLLAGKTYHFMVSYIINGKASENTESISVTIYPKSTSAAKPKVSASSSKYSVMLSWSAVSGAKKYAVYKYENGKVTKLTETKLLAAKLVDLSPKTRYRFIVRAYVNGKWTKMTRSDIVTVKTK